MIPIPAPTDEQDNPSLCGRRDKESPGDGFQGTKCAQGIDECRPLLYPCADGNKRGSFCVDYDPPPKKLKCGCLPGYDAVLPNNAGDVKDNVPVNWRPLACIARDVCVDVVCHEDATCGALYPRRTARRFAHVTQTLSSETASPIALLLPSRLQQSRHHHNNRNGLVKWIQNVTQSRILFVSRMCANARPVSTEATGKAVVSMRMSQV